MNTGSAKYCVNSSRKEQITQILSQCGDDQARVADQLMPVLYDELRAMAERFLVRERLDHTLQPTAVVHEAYLQLVEQDRVNWQGRSHFLGVAAMCMRRILVNHAERKKCIKRGGQLSRSPLDEDQIEAEGRSIDLVALDEALTKLATLDAHQARIVELRFFGGLTVEETATVLESSPRTIYREWAMAKAWLRGELGRSD